MHASHPFKPQGARVRRPRSQTFEIPQITKNGIDGLHPRCMGGVHNSLPRKERLVAVPGFHYPQVGGVIFQADCDGNSLLASLSDRKSILNPERRFQNRHQPSRPRDPVITFYLGHSLFDRNDLVWSLGFWDQNEVRRFRHDLVQVFQSQRKLIDAHHALAVEEIDCSQRVSYQQASGILFAGMYGIFEVENDGVRSVQCGVDKILRLASGNIKTRSSDAVAGRSRWECNSVGKYARALAQARAPRCSFDTCGNYEGQGTLILHLHLSVTNSEFFENGLSLATNRVAVIGFDSRMQLNF